MLKFGPVKVPRGVDRCPQVRTDRATPESPVTVTLRVRTDTVAAERSVEANPESPERVTPGICRKRVTPEMCSQKVRNPFGVGFAGR